jgi:hypothetical protein
MRKSRVFELASGNVPMEAERINLIGNQLEGLSARVHELRGYL